MQHTYTEEEFKQVLKNLFAEKKRVKDLEKRLEEKGLQKRFQAKLSDIHKFSLTEEYAKLKAAYQEKENECATLKIQLEKICPALKKLMLDLKSATLKAQSPLESEEVKQALSVLQNEVASLQEKNSLLEEGLSRKATEANSLQELVEKLHDKENAYETLLRQKEKGDEELLTLTQTLSEVEQKERMVEYQMAAVHGEKETLIGKVSEFEKEVERKGEALAAKENETAQLKTALEETRKQWEQSDFALLRNEYETKVRDALIAFSKKENAHEESLERCYVKMREMSQRHAAIVEERESLLKKIEDHNKILAKFDKEQGITQTALKNAKLQCEESDAELRKAQQHLAKKMKETALLQDMAESQKAQTIELQAVLEKQKGEIDRLQNNIQLQREHETKMQEMMKERIQAAESLSKEWQEKYLVLQKEWQEAKDQVGELQKLRKSYEQMAITFSSLKSIIGQPLEPPQDPQDPRH